MTDHTIIQSGGNFRVIPSGVTTHEALPAQTYTVQFSPMTGWSLEQVDDLDAGAEKVYGNHRSVVDRITRTYGELSRSLGVLFSGDKGMGKSLTIRMLAEKVKHELGLPVVLVNRDYEGIEAFLDTLGECFIVFDEFDKIFESDDGYDNSQSKFLGLFDGSSAQKRLYAVIVNRTHLTNQFLLNRPGRFHYHIRFDYPTSGEVEQYVRDNLPTVSDEDMEAIHRFCVRTPINYDHLRAIVFEMRHGDTFEDIIPFLNIKQSPGSLDYIVDVTFDDGTTKSQRRPISVDSGSFVSFELNSVVEKGWVTIKLNLLDGVTDNGSLVFNKGSFTATIDTDTSEDSREVERVRLTLNPQTNINF